MTENAGRQGETSRPNLREVQREHTRGLLVDAARHIFEERGYVDVKVDDIASQAGASRGTFYLHYESKAAIMREVHGHLIAEAASIANPLREADAVSEEALVAYFEDVLDFYLERRNLQLAMHQARAVDKVFAQAHIDDVEALVDRMGELEFGRGRDRSSLLVTALMMYSLLDHFIFLWLQGEWDIGKEQVTRALARALASTLDDA